MRFKLFFLIIAAVLISAAGAWAENTEEGWNTLSRKRFIIYYKQAPYDFVETVATSAEQYYTGITRDLGFTRYKGWMWDDRAKIYIFDDAQDYVESGKHAQWSHGVTSPKNKIIRTFPSAHGFFDSTLPHELTHIIFREFVGYKARLPTWFEEGVAMSQEKARRWGAHDTVRQALKDGTFKSLNELSLIRLNVRSSQESVQLFYAESASAVNFLINEYGKERFVRLCRKLQEGGPFEWAVDSVYARLKNIDDLNEAWVRFLKNE